MLAAASQPCWPFVALCASPKRPAGGPPEACSLPGLFLQWPRLPDPTPVPGAPQKPCNAPKRRAPAPLAFQLCAGDLVQVHPRKRHQPQRRRVEPPTMISHGRSERAEGAVSMWRRKLDRILVGLLSAALLLPFRARVSGHTGYHHRVDACVHLRDCRILLLSVLRHVKNALVCFGCRLECLWRALLRLFLSKLQEPRGTRAAKEMRQVEFTLREFPVPLTGEAILRCLDYLASHQRREIRILTQTQNPALVCRVGHRRASGNDRDCIGGGVKPVLCGVLVQHL